MPVPLHCDFIADLRQHYANELLALGHPAEGSVVDVCRTYFGILRRSLPVRPRRAPVSAALHRRLEAGPEEHRRAVGRIVGEVERGENLQPRLSRSITKPNYNDLLLNDWGIHHLHIGETLDPDGFVKRQKELLYVLDRGDVLYLIDLLGHGNESFANQELMEILHAEWPQAIVRLRAVGVVPGSLTPANLTPDQRQRMRKLFVVGTQVADGTVYTPDGGSTVGGGSFIASQLACRQCNTAADLQEQLEGRADRMRDLIQDRTGRVLDELHVKLVVGPPWSFVETTTGERFHVPNAA